MDETPIKRKYRGTVQAEVAALTRQRIIDAIISLFPDKWLDQITLDQVAEKAGVTVQTILRHFGSKDGLAVAAARHFNAQGHNPRDEAIAGDLENIVDNLTGHYEQLGDSVFRSLLADEQFPQLREFLQDGRDYHRRWIERVFAPWLDGLNAERQRMAIVQLIAVCDVYVWKILRRDQRLTVDQYRRTLMDMLQALLSSYGRG